MAGERANRLSARLLGLGAWSDYAPDWPGMRELLRGNTWAAEPSAPAGLPVAEGLPPTEKRRATPGTRLAIAVAREAVGASGLDPARLRSVFASSASSPAIIHELCESMAAGDWAISPTRFHNSVHNAPAGYYGIGAGSMLASTTIGAGDYSATFGLLEAIAMVMSTAEPVLFVSYDHGYPEPLAARRSIAGQWAIALVLGPAPEARDELARETELRLLADAADHQAPDHSAPLAMLAKANPTCRLLPLLRALVHRDPGTVWLASGESRRMAFEWRHGTDRDAGL